VICFFFPPALMLVPLVGYFWFKADALEVDSATDRLFRMSRMGEENLKTPWQRHSPLWFVSGGPRPTSWDE
jgi:hypothetical protein